MTEKQFVKILHSVYLINKRRCPTSRRLPFLRSRGRCQHPQGCLLSHHRMPSTGSNPLIAISSTEQRLRQGLNDWPLPASIILLTHPDKISDLRIFYLSSIPQFLAKCSSLCPGLL
jgi:hypothetical protein